ncbi:MAG: barstar family protein [Oscillospiraceae bacterium]|nr:barstar family protein [Oscillospiraceae bacterium]
MTVVLDGRCLCSREEAHDHLVQNLSLPAYYGRNLDALYDALTDRGEPLHIIIEHAQDTAGYGLRIMNTIADAANNTSALTFEKKGC